MANGRLRGSDADAAVRGSLPLLGRVLLVGQGASGGVGRYEVLVHNALATLSRSSCLEFRSIFKSQFPDYLRSGLIYENLWNAKDNRRSFILKSLHELLVWRPQLVVFSHVNLALLGVVGQFIRPRLRYAIAVYGIEVWEDLSPLRRLTLRRGRRILAVSRYTGEQVRERHAVSSGNVIIVPAALDVRMLDASPTSAGRHSDSGQMAQLGSNLLLSVSRLTATDSYKGVDTTIEALPKVLRAFPDVTYTVVGEGDDLPRLRALAERVGVAERVSFPGSLADEELRRLYQQCTLFVLPSAKEGFGIVFLEAMAYGKAVIGGRHAGTLDVIDHGRTGVLVEHGNVDELSNAVIALLADPERRRSLGQAGYERLHAEFTFERFVERFAAVLKELRDSRDSRDSKVVPCAG